MPLKHAQLTMCMLCASWMFYLIFKNIIKLALTRFRLTDWSPEFLPMFCCDIFIFLVILELVSRKSMATGFIVACLLLCGQPARSSCHLRSRGERRPLSSQVTVQPRLRCPWLLTWLAGQTDFFFVADSPIAQRWPRRTDCRRVADHKVRRCSCNVHGMLSDGMLA